MCVQVWKPVCEGICGCVLGGEYQRILLFSLKAPIPLFFHSSVEFSRMICYGSLVFHGKSSARVCSLPS
jgi:hypothetical protein